MMPNPSEFVINALQQDQEFRQWLRLFSGELVVHIVVYADESGTHDESGLLAGSEVAVISGWAAKPESWIKFKAEWEKALKHHSVPYFHFREWTIAALAAKESGTKIRKSNPYAGRTIEELNALLYELAAIAGGGNKIPVGGYVDTQKYAQFFSNVPKEQRDNPHHGAIWWFFDAAMSEISAKWPKLKGPISFFFDRTSDDGWRNAIGTVHHSWSQRNARVGELVFADKKNKDHVALQAADMLTCRLRQIARKCCQYDDKIPHGLPELDKRLFGKFVQSGSQFSRLFPISGAKLYPRG